jgi:excinuclease ABC subunit C
MDIPDELKEKLRKIPDAPGCYMMRDRRGEIIYVGKAVSLRKRVQSYFREAAQRQASPKLRSLVNSVYDLDVVVVRNEAEAVLTEGKLIKDYRPRYNVSFRDDKRFLLLRADPGEPFPRFTLCRIRRDDGAVYLGPYASSAAARAALDFVEKRFGLRKCTPRIPGAETYRRCLNDIIRYCSAPCIGEVDERDYRERFGDACAFLRGERPRILKDLRESMQKLADGMEFEKAAALRDTLLLLERAVQQRVRVASTPAMKREEAAAGVRDLQSALHLPAAPEVIEAYDISNISGTYAVASMVCFVEGMPHRNRYRRFRIRSVTGIDDPAMMAEVIRRRFTRLREEDERPPGLVVVDGGATQLKAARGELDRLGFRDVPAAALAKRFEELHSQDDRPPLRLPRASSALRLLQRLRDEAHRFALAYHRRLRGKRIRESMLDDIPGIGERKKKALIERFGSVGRLEAAAPEEIAEVRGIGPRLARVIKEHIGRKAEHGRDAQHE